MPHAIRQFMWAFQPHLRSSIRQLAERSLTSIGVEVAPKALLIGFREVGEESFPICVEPEDKGFDPTEFDHVMDRAEEIYQAHELRNNFHTDAEAHERFHRGLLDGCRAAALLEALERRQGELNREFFVGASAIVENYRVYPVISVVRSRWNRYPTLGAVQSEHRVKTQRSFQHAVVEHVLNATTRSMSTQAAPVEVGHTVELSQDIIRHALSDFTARLTFVHANWEGTGFADSMNALSAQPYEGRTGVGTVVLSKNDHPDVEVILRFDTPVRLERTRSFRKALEMTGSDLYLLSDGVVAYGLGRLTTHYVATNENRFVAQVTGRGTWELRHESTPLVRSENGIPSLPRERISKEKFVDTVERVFSQSDAELLWNLTLQAAEQQHGTMLVVHAEAAAEAQRLAPQALSIEPSFLSAATLAAVTSIDGAVLVDPMGECHAVGVILDGEAVTGMGDAARGARFNSAVRYHHGLGDVPCVIVIVSEDGMINVLPSLRRRVSRDDVANALSRLNDVSRGAIDFAEAAEAWRHVESLAFYLSPHQCKIANAARERVEGERERQVMASGTPGITRVGYKRIDPDPAMNESYFL